MLATRSKGGFRREPGPQAVEVTMKMHSFVRASVLVALATPTLSFAVPPAGHPSSCLRATDRDLDQAARRHGRSTLADSTVLVQTRRAESSAAALSGWELDGALDLVDGVDAAMVHIAPRIESRDASGTVVAIPGGDFLLRVRASDAAVRDAYARTRAGLPPAMGNATGEFLDAAGNVVFTRPASLQRVSSLDHTPGSTPELVEGDIALERLVLSIWYQSKDWRYCIDIVIIKAE